MKVFFHKNASNSLKSFNEKHIEIIKDKIFTLLINIEKNGTLPYKELKIKKLKGEWDGFFRMRLSKIRIIFRIDKESDTLLIYEIDYRGNLYK